MRGFRSFLGVGLVLALALFIGGAEPGKSAVPGGHLADQECAGCHLGKKDLNQNSARKLIASQEKLCKRCHANAMVVSHPSGISVERDMPRELPLDWKGDMTCSTCHDIHGEKPGLMRTAKKGAKFCQMCHSAEFFKNIRDGGASVMRSGHIANKSFGEQQIDGYTSLCIECHAKELTAPTVTIDSQGVVRHASGSSNHPVGVSYLQAYAFGGYRPMNSLPDEVLLPDGRLSCASCHMGYSQEHGKLVSAYPAMCSTLCHDL